MIVAVDQSGSMLDSAIYSAVMASIFVELPAVRTSLFLFDTDIADLTDQVGQPVEHVLWIQLGGGTNITATQYAYQLTRQPARTIVVLVANFCEGRAERDLVAQVKEDGAGRHSHDRPGRPGLRGPPGVQQDHRQQVPQSGDGHPLLHAGEAGRGDGAYNSRLRLFHGIFFRSRLFNRNSQRYESVTIVCRQT